MSDVKKVKKSKKSGDKAKKKSKRSGEKKRREPKSTTATTSTQPKVKKAKSPKKGKKRTVAKKTGERSIGFRKAQVMAVMKSSASAIIVPEKREVKSKKTGKVKVKIMRVRITEKAIALASSHVESWFAELGKKASIMAEHYGRKTISDKLLFHSLHEIFACHPGLKNDLIIAVNADKKTKKEKKEARIGRPSAARAFAAGFENKHLRISSKARSAIAALAHMKFQKLGKKSAAVARAAKRRTIKTNDLEVVFLK